VVVGDAEYQSNLFHWLSVHRNGVHVRRAPMPNGELPSSALADAIDEGMSLVALSVVQSATGYRTNLDAVVARCAEVGAQLFL
jgi:cysteine desulfurase / selenocysteine lyase